MDDIAESLISRFISQLKVRLVEVFEVFNLELERRKHGKRTLYSNTCNGRWNNT